MHNIKYYLGQSRPGTDVAAFIESDLEITLRQTLTKGDVGISVLDVLSAGRRCSLDTTESGEELRLSW